MEFDLNKPTEFWIKYFNLKSANKDLIILFENEDDAIWFATKIGQKLSVLGGSEVVSICGSLVNELHQFSAQVNVSLPSGYRMSSNPDALYDILLNFETEPENRVIIWNDAQYLFNLSLTQFELIFEILVVTAYMNRQGIGTIKENGEKYQVNQRNIFVFIGVKKHQLKFLLDKEYLIEEQNVDLYFEIVTVPDDSDISTQR